MASIICGNCHEIHFSVATVRRCYAGETVPCGDLYWDFTEDGRVVRSCTAARWATDRGSECEAGHEHVDTETRNREGWDYVADETEAYYLRRQGIDAVAMNGGSI